MGRSFQNTVLRVEKGTAKKLAATLKTHLVVEQDVVLVPRAGWLFVFTEQAVSFDAPALWVCVTDSDRLVLAVVKNGRRIATAKRSASRRPTTALPTAFNQLLAKGRKVAELTAAWRSEVTVVEEMLSELAGPLGLDGDLLISDLDAEREKPSRDAVVLEAARMPAPKPSDEALRLWPNVPQSHHLGSEGGDAIVARPESFGRPTRGFTVLFHGAAVEQHLLTGTARTFVNRVSRPFTLRRATHEGRPALLLDAGEVEVPGRFVAPPKLSLAKRMEAESESRLVVFVGVGPLKRETECQVTLTWKETGSSVTEGTKFIPTPWIT
jgi:hypothetical protein